MPVTAAALRRFAVARSLFPPAQLSAALDQLGFVQADPIRAPARAQDRRCVIALPAITQAIWNGTMARSKSRKTCSSTTAL